MKIFSAMHISEVYQNGYVYGIAYLTGHPDEFEIFDQTFTTEEFAEEYAAKHVTQHTGNKLFVVALKAEKFLSTLTIKNMVVKEVYKE